jgi:hypothetical protein
VKNRAILLLILVFMTLIIFPIRAQDETIRIDWPPSVYDLAGKVNITGTANPPNLVSYFLEAAEYNPEATGEPFWLPVSLPSTTPVINGVLGTWDTTVYPDGLYQLRLHVRLSAGEDQYFVVAPLRIGNTLERPAGELQPQVVPPPVATEEVAVAPPAPTVVPRPNTVNLLPLPVGGHVTKFEDSTVEAMQSAGMTWMKWQIPFVVGDDSLIQVALDRINFAHENGFYIFLSIKGDKDELGAMEEDYYPPYADFVGRIAELGPDAIQVWNEQNLDREWPNGKIDPAAYVELLRQAHTAIKAVDPQIMVVTGAPAPTGAEGAFGSAAVWNDDRYYQGMAYADCIGVHYNEGIVAPQQQGGDPRTPDYPTRYLPLMIQRAAFPFRGTDIPLCFSELGYLTPDGYGPLPLTFGWAANNSVEEQATWLRDAIQIAAQTSSVRIALIIVWNVDFDVYTQDDPQGGYAIIRPDESCPACESIGSLRSDGQG